jgi:hypothetical protein
VVQAVQAKTTTSAPAVPMTLGSKPATQADDARAAIASGDMARYNAIMNARDGAKS